MLLVQRSGDLLVASGPGGINELAYACFLLALSAHCGCKPGVFTHLCCNEQLYSRHLSENEAGEMLSRAGNVTIADYKPTENMPRIVLNPDKTDFFSLDINDFQVEDYDPCYPQIPLELGI